MFGIGSTELLIILGILVLLAGPPFLILMFVLRMTAKDARRRGDRDTDE